MNASLRIIDASANRASEALRVLEDLARFALDRPDLATPVKDIRHGLRAALDAAELGRTSLARARDVEGDTGLGVRGAGEGARAGLSGVASAAGARVGEALRSIEEQAKALGLDPARSGAFESLRYRAYEAERAILLALARHPCPQWSVCVIVTRDLCTARACEVVVRESLLAGAEAIQLREKSLGDRDRLALARRLVGVARECAPEGVVIVNDRPDLALLSGADGVHVGRGDLDPRDARRVMERAWRRDRDPIVGASTSNPDEARAAAGAGADYCGIGAVFATATKTDPRVVGPGALERYLADASLARVPHLAIGGITPERVGVLRAAGCRGVAVSSCVCGSEDPGRVVGALRAALVTSDSRADAR